MYPSVLENVPRIRAPFKISDPSSVIPRVTILSIDLAHQPLPLGLQNLDELLDHKSDLSEKLCQIGDSIVYKLVQWTKRLPFYLELPVEVHTRLLTHKWHELLVLTTSAYQAMHGQHKFTNVGTDGTGADFMQEVITVSFYPRVQLAPWLQPIQGFGTFTSRPGWSRDTEVFIHSGIETGNVCVFPIETIALPKTRTIEKCMKSSLTESDPKVDDLESEFYL